MCCGADDVRLRLHEINATQCSPFVSQYSIVPSTKPHEQIEGPSCIPPTLTISSMRLPLIVTNDSSNCFITREWGVCDTNSKVKPGHSERFNTLYSLHQLISAGGCCQEQKSRSLFAGFRLRCMRDDERLNITWKVASAIPLRRDRRVTPFSEWNFMYKL